jgi:diguanylate cyclase (GGDEF)-like protein
MLNLVYTMQADCYALIIVSIIILNHRKKADLTNTSNKIFLILLVLNVAALLLELTVSVLDGIPGETAHLALSISTCLFFFVNPFPCLLWLAYADYFIHGKLARLKRYAISAAAPAFAIGLLSIASLFGNVLFYIGSDNILHRGTFYLLLPITCNLYVIFTTILIVCQRKRIRHEDLIPLLFFALPPFLGGVLQTTLDKVTLLWPGLTISLLLVFVFLQSTLMNTDHLTKLYNRREFDRYLHTLAQRGTKKKCIAGIMMDLDSFKRINDRYGHSIGDRALVNMSRILKDSFRQNDFISRIGGDEFAIILELNEETDLDHLLQRLDENILLFNATQTAPYKLSVSIGCGLFCPESDRTLIDFFHQLDSKMYEEKKKRRYTS